MKSKDVQESGDSTFPVTISHSLRNLREVTFIQMYARVICRFGISARLTLTYKIRLDLGQALKVNVNKLSLSALTVCDRRQST